MPRQGEALQQFPPYRYVNLEIKACVD